MLFNSYEFLFLFFPGVLAAFLWLGPRRARHAIGLLALASLFFYGWWSWKALPLLLASIAFNHAMAGQVSPASGRTERSRKWLLRAALVANLGLLGVFKYADFFIHSVNAALSAAQAPSLPLLGLALPIGISFYTFTQIAFLVDAWHGKVQEKNLLNYGLFVTYFPHLIAGPVLHHAQMMPQFADPAIFRAQPGKIALGLAIFTFGLAKKLLLADPLGQYADLVFDGVKAGTAVGAMLPMLTAWLGAWAYAFQIYFDFSGYSDMAVGISLCFGVQLPLNFLSPYRATNIIEFWRRWHVSLSTFLRDYLYVPLGGNRLGRGRRYINLFVTMLLGGLWHGAAWTFVLWGAMHGLFLTLNHLWRERLRAPEAGWRGALARAAGGALTFLCVCLAWVMFRADSVASAMEIYRGMFGLNGISGSPFAFVDLPYKRAHFYLLLLVGWLICLLAPTSVELAHRCVPSIAPRRWPRAGTVVSALAVGGLFAWGVSRLGSHSAFLYFQF